MDQETKALLKNIADQISNLQSAVLVVGFMILLGIMFHGCMSH